MSSPAAMRDTLAAEPSVDFSSLRSIVHTFIDRAHATPDRIALTVYPAGGEQATATLTWGQWHRAACHMALALMRSGVQRGDRVVVLSRNRPLWPIADMAIQMIGAVGVGIYPTSAPSQVATMLADCTPTLVLTDTIANADVVMAALAQIGQTVLVVCDDDRARQTGATGAASGIVSLAEWRSVHAAEPSASPDDDTLLQARLAAITLDDLAALVYTSGSTGDPKGACLTHRYLAASAASTVATLGLDARDRTLSFLPYSHAAERVFGQCTRVLTGMEAALVEDPADVFRVAAAFEPTFLGGLPRIFERLFEAAEVARRNGTDPRDAMASRIGRLCRLATSGGATLPQHVAEALLTLGLPILGAYGQTEHLCVAMHRPDDVRFDSVGRPMPGTEVRLDENGELLVRRNALTFAGYWRNEADTRTAFTADGAWLRTGDRAELQADGTLRIVGRVKELIALSNGRKVAPLPIEAALVASPFIAHAVCHGEGRKYLTVLLSLRRDVVEAWARQQHLDMPWPAIGEHPLLRAELQRAVDTVNGTLARTDRVQAFAITTQPFSPESGELTPTYKLVRATIDTRFADTFDRMYS